jgi:hypothetical protein
VEMIDNDAKSLKLEVFKLAWYMRGAVSIDEAFALTYEDREIISKLVEDNLETTKKSGLPFF